ncbi:hypothetical protein C5T94_17655 [Raoultella ornithinolytica]|nr:hypothetical protein AN237_22815 [Raoultella ornithinolytica]ATM19682.1 hypothetical protein CRN13_04245 [Raoultella ornithinolytica]OWP42547.1 hypothetical protein CEG93_12315 [Raoultella ornithinolytica]OZV27930.1 hypothetical protein CA956_22035 [Raoultella ornithinolytica]OZV34304.1 hypothetical protein CA952_07745 [Raoultella ornithinolytica]
MNMVRRPQEKFSWTSREHQCSWIAAKRTGSTVYTVLPFFMPVFSASPLAVAVGERRIVWAMLQVRLAQPVWPMPL